MLTDADTFMNSGTRGNQPSQSERITHERIFGVCDFDKSISKQQAQKAVEAALHHIRGVRDLDLTGANLAELQLESAITYLSMQDRMNAVEGDRATTIMAQSHSAVDLGLFRGLSIEVQDEELTLVVKYTATTDQCPHKGGLEDGFTQATTDLFYFLREIIPTLSNATLEYVPGVWTPENIDAEIKSTTTSIDGVHQALRH